MNVKTKQVDLFEIRSYKSLRDDEIVERICSIANQSSLLTWRLFAELSGRFKSKNAFGEYLRKCREDQESPLWGISSSTVTRYVQAGTFCNKLKITDLNRVGISKTVIYKLAEPGNQEFAHRIFNEIKNLHVTVDEVDQLIMKYSAVADIKREPELIELPPSDFISRLAESQPRRIIDVIKGIAQEPEPTEEETIIEPPAQEIPPIYEELERPDDFINDSDDEQEEARPTVPFYRRQELLTALSMMDASHLTEEERVDEILLLSKSYRMAPNRLIPTFTMCAKNCLPNYHKRPPAH